jgi:hypothetical protein
MFRGVIFTLLLAFTSRAHADRVELSAVIAHPERFDSREVTVVGLAADNGNGLYVFPTFEAASKGTRHTQGAAYVPYPHEVNYHRHWVEITGVVHAERHGWADENPCEIWMTHFRDLRREGRVLWPEDIGLFLNATSATIMFESEVNGGGSEVKEVKPHQSDDAIIIPSGRLIVYKRPGMKVMFTTKLQYPKRRPEDPSERRFRFAVHENGLEFVGEEGSSR